jgi:hypothetical protein
MAITAVYTTGAVAGTTATANLVLTPPSSSAAVGDFALVVVGQRKNTADTITQVADTTAGTRTFTKLRYGAQATTSSTSIWYRILQSGDPGVGNVNTWTVTGSAIAEGTLCCYTGVNTTTPIDAQGTINTSTTTPATFNAVTTTTANAMFIGACSENIGTAVVSAQTSGSPTLTIRANAGNAGAASTRQGIAIVDGIITSAGSSGAYVWSLVSGAVWGTDTFALRPASTTPPVLAEYNYSIAIQRATNY